MQRVFVVDQKVKPLMPCHPARARRLLREKRAVVHRYRPFTIRLLDQTGWVTQPTAVKLDPGYATTGIAVVVTGKRGRRVVWAAELKHRGNIVKARLQARAMVRRGRRTRKLRYRPPRFLNRREKFRRVARWLPPSLNSRIDNMTCWVDRIRRYAPITSISFELNKFDTQKMENPEISGVEYQRGELHGYEVYSYLLEKWGRKCAYCGAENVPFQIEHIIPKSRGGSNRVSNLALSCGPCNQTKGSMTAAEFGHPKVQEQAQKPLKAAAAMTATRWALWERLTDIGLDLEIGTGGRTRFNRTRQGYHKAHWIDAACVGPSGRDVIIPASMTPLLITALGRGSRQICMVNKHGFPVRHRARHRQNYGFRTRDLVLARPIFGRHAGKVRVATITASRASAPKLSLRDAGFEIHPKFCTLLQRADGYSYDQ